MRYLLLILIFAGCKSNGQTPKSDSIPFFRIEKAPKLSYSILIETAKSRTVLTDSTGEVAYKNGDSAWVVLDTAAALRVSLISLEQYTKTQNDLYKKVRTHEIFMRWLNDQTCGNFLFNQFYKSVYPDNKYVETPEYNSQ